MGLVTIDGWAAIETGGDVGVAISAATTEAGLTIRAERDTEYYENGVKVSDKEMAAFSVTAHEWHGDWNYTLAAAATA